MIKQLAIKLHLWEENVEEEINKVVHEVRSEMREEFIQEAYKHYCYPCKRWFSDVRGKLAHARFKHKDA